MKSCITCKVDKPLTDYHKRKSSKDGLQHKCKSCVKEWDTIYKSRNKQHTKQYDKANEERFAENRKKASDRQKEIKHKPIIQGGNGRGATIQQLKLYNELIKIDNSFEMEVIEKRFRRDNTENK